MTSEKDTLTEKKQRNLFYSFMSLLGIMLIPLCVCIPLLYSILTSSLLYTGILKNARLVETFIHAKNWQMEEQIKEEIEEKVHLEEYKAEFQKIKEDYEKKKSHLDTLNKKAEFDNLKLQKKELAGLSWKKAPGIFASEDEFDKYKKEELARLGAKLDDIEKHRDQFEDEIEKAEDELSTAEDAFEDAKDTMEDKEEEASDIIKSHKNSFIGKVYADVEIISPPLTDELNDRLINIAVKREIEKYLYFMTHYEEEVKQGNVYRDTLNLSGQGFQDTLKIRIPRLEISLWVDDEVNGIAQKRHLLSEIFVDRIERLEGLKKKSLLVNLFKFSDSGLAERFSRSYLRKARLNINDGIITMDQIELSGRDADMLEKIMKGLTWGRYICWALLVLAVILLSILVFSSADREKKVKSIRRILLYPGIIFILITLVAVAVSMNIDSIFPGLFTSPLVLIYMKRIFLVVTLHIFVPILVVFVAMALAGSFLKVRKKPEQEITTDAGSA